MVDIKAIIFDFGGVLNCPDDKAAWNARLDQIAGEYGWPSGYEFWQYLFVCDAWKQSERGIITEQDFWMDRLGPLGLKTVTEQQAFWDRIYAGEEIHPVMLRILEQLHGRYTLAVLSNTNVRNMADWLANRWKLAGIFDVVVASVDVGLAKPDEAIFRLALDRLAIRPEEALFIDDMDRNTTAAERLGIQTILFETPEALEAALHTRDILREPPQAARGA